MSMQRSLRHAHVWGTMIGLALFAWILCESTAFGQFPGRGSGRHGSGDKGHQPEQPNPNRNFKPPPPLAMLTPHGGEFFATDTNRYEIVFMPLQTRIYLYDTTLKPLSARDVHVQMSFELPTENIPRRIPFQYVSMPAQAAEQDYVVASLDLRQLTDKETPITFEFSGLADRRHPTASFTPVFSPPKMRPYVAQVLLMQADRSGITRQQICPVTGARLGDRGPVVKVYIGDYPLYLSGEDCIGAVKETPEKYLPQPMMPVTSR